MKRIETVKRLIARALRRRVVFGDVVAAGGGNWRLPVTIDGRSCLLTLAAINLDRHVEWTCTVTLLGVEEYANQPVCELTAVLAWREPKTDEHAVIAMAKRWAASKLVALAVRSHVDARRG